MALYVINARGEESIWRVRENVPKTFRAIPSANSDDANVVLVQADGHELDYIFANFENIPRCKNCVQRWYGETAQFIAGNLK